MKDRKMKDRKTDPNTQVLRRQAIDASGPGSILRDFETLLEFIGAEGPAAPGKYHFLPLERLGELDAKMSRPLRPRLERPQQRSFPAIDGLYLLLRATRLGMSQGMGKKTGMLVLDQAMLDQWRTMNATEHYFNLLEAWLRHGRPEMLGERAGWMASMLGTLREIWQRVPSTAPRASLWAAPRYMAGFPFAASPWPSCSGCWTSRGRACRGGELAGPRRSSDRVRRGLGGDHYREAAGPPDSSRPPRGRAGLRGLAIVVPGVLPERRKNLVFPEPEHRDGVFVFKAKLGSVWSRIAVPAACDLDALAWAILGAFKFDGDHLYDFCFPGRDGSQVQVACPYIDDAEAWTDDYPIGDLPLAEGQSMGFNYDYGAGWRFDVKLEEVGPPNPRLKKARLVELHGKPPQEYGDWEDE